jgi:tripartite ATP-independent transporter DctM subunit
MILVMFALLVVFIMIGIPVAFSIGLTSLITMFILGIQHLLPSCMNQMYAQTVSYPLLAIPFFILAGSLMNTGGMTDKVFRFARYLVGYFPGGLAHVNVVTSMLFAGMSGSAVADAAGVGKIEIKAMNDAGYEPHFSAGITAASSTIGPVIPPSIPFVIYGSITGISVGKLFLGGVIPGAGMGLVLMMAVYLISRKRNFPRDQFPPLKDLLWAGMEALPALGTPLIIIGGIVFGFFTPTEASVVACAYSLVVGILMRGITWTNIGEIFFESFIQTTQIMFIVVVSAIFGWLLVFLRAPNRLIEIFTSVTSEPGLILLMIILLLLILGCFMESIAIMLTVVPMIAPVADKLGLDPVHFGVVVTLALMIGLITPPFGMTLFAVSTVTHISPERLYREVAFYIVALILLLLFVAYYPPLTLFVPKLFMP